MTGSAKERITQKYQRYVMPTYAPSLLLTRGAGSWLWDDTGRRYLDFASGISVCNLGHCHPAITEAISKQASELVHVSNLYMNEPQITLAEKLIQHCFDGTVFFANSGAEANEGLIKFARKWGSPQNKTDIITMCDSFHGRTLATLAATGRSKYREGFAPDMPGFKQVPFNDLTAIKQAIDYKTAAILLEPIQGEGGIIPANAKYLQAVRELCDQHNILLLFDEVQCGMGRTGNFFAFQGYDIEPDALSLAKALGNGFPIGAFIVQRKHANVLTAGSHASTFGGTPLACAAAAAVIDTMDNENTLDNCLIQSKTIFTALQNLQLKYPALIKEVRGRGLMIGIEINGNPAPILPILLKYGMIALPAGENVLRLMPPLNITASEVEQGITMLQNAFSEFAEAQKQEG